MKKLLSLLVVLTMTLGAMAQSQHLKFMGIPLNGTISAFHQKLVAKGYKPDVEVNKRSRPGSRYFKGTFFGSEAVVYVYYNPKTKIVYRAKAVLKYTSEGIMQSVYQELKVALGEKYSGALVSKGESHGYEDMTYYVDEGRIDLFCAKYDLSYPTYYNVYVDYWDDINSKKNEDKNMDDL